MKNFIKFALFSLLGWTSKAAWYRAKYLLQVAAASGTFQAQAIEPNYGRLPAGTYLVMANSEPWYLAKVYRDQTTVLVKRFDSRMVTVSSFPLWKRDSLRDNKLLACPNDSCAIHRILGGGVETSNIIEYMDNTVYAISRDGHYFSKVIAA